MCLTYLYVVIIAIYTHYIVAFWCSLLWNDVLTFSYTECEQLIIVVCHFHYHPNQNIQQKAIVILCKRSKDKIKGKPTQFYS